MAGKNSRGLTAPGTTGRADGWGPAAPGIRSAALRRLLAPRLLWKVQFSSARLPRAVGDGGNLHRKRSPRRSAGRQGEPTDQPAGHPHHELRQVPGRGLDPSAVLGDPLRVSGHAGAGRGGGVKKRLADHHLRPLVLRGDTDLGRGSSVDELAGQLAVLRKDGRQVHVPFPQTHRREQSRWPTSDCGGRATWPSKHGVTIVLETHPDLGGNGRRPSGNHAANPSPQRPRELRHRQHHLSTTRDSTPSPS